MGTVKITFSHPCDACGGTGEDSSAIDRAAERLFDDLGVPEHQARCYPSWPGNHIVRLVAQRLSDGKCATCVVDAECPVCLGAGSFPDRMPARDAVADAETLYGIAYAEALAERERDAVFCHLYSAREAGRMAIGGARDFAGERGELAARAAFRAVPGLRGE